MIHAACVPYTTVCTAPHLAYHPPTVYHPRGHCFEILNNHLSCHLGDVYTAPPKVIPHNHYDTPRPEVITAGGKRAAINETSAGPAQHSSGSTPDVRKHRNQS